MVQEGIGATRDYDVEGTLKTPGRAPEPVAGHVQLLRTRSGVLVRAHLTMTEPEDCSRCLRPLMELVKIDFEEEFQATVDALTGRPVEERPDQDAFLIDSNHTLDLTEAIRQYREASATMQPLCRPDCRGLCPRCGRDLNEGDCGCSNTEVDSRLAGLASLLEGGLEN
ncbi:MAG TPA: DUF177 domain-containing protein [Dehalococcoidia bacterium]|nr:DUF177 domain-containing protein [Dehalococcoidia bacterium]